MSFDSGDITIRAKTPLFIVGPGDVLLPMSSNASSVLTDNNHKTDNLDSNKVGATWTNSGNLNIDLDNLLGNRGGKPSHTPSMNQLASTPTSPTNQPRPPNQIYAAAPTAYSPQNNQQQFFTAFK